VKLDNVAVVMLSTAGGAVWTLPVLNAIKRAHPGARISWVIQPGAAALIEGHPSVDRVIPFERGAGWRAYGRLRRAVSGEEYDTVLVLQSYLKSAAVGALLKTGNRIAIDRNRAQDVSWLFPADRLESKPVGHMQDQYLEFLQPLDVTAEPLAYRLGPWEREREWQQRFFQQFTRPAVPLVIGTTKEEKDWPAENWAEIVDILWHDFAVEPVLVGARTPRELKAEQVIMARSRHRPRSALGSGLRRLLAILDGSVLAISPDTGPLHMAVAIDKPVISLFGYTNPKRTGPYRKFHDLLIDAFGNDGEEYTAAAPNRSGRMNLITVGDVLDKIERWRAVYASSAAKR
jgi:heptosyltransferase I